MSRYFRVIILITLIAGCLIPYADAVAEGRSDAVRFRFAPYLWLSEYSGSVYSRGTESDLNTDAFDFNQNLAGFMHIQATWHNRFALLFDHNYRRWDKIYKIPADVSKVSGWMYTTEISGAYAITDKYIIVPELIIGGRFTHLRSKIVDAIGTTDEKTRTWFDPFIGFRATVPLSPRFFAAARGDIGGILVGSKASWNVSGLIGYRIINAVSIGAGYRVYDVRYETGDGEDLFKYDVQTRGPFTGVEFYF